METIQNLRADLFCKFYVCYFHVPHIGYHNYSKLILLFDLLYTPIAHEVLPVSLVYSVTAKVDDERKDLAYSIYMWYTSCYIHLQEAHARATYNNNLTCNRNLQEAHARATYNNNLQETHAGATCNRSLQEAMVEDGGGVGMVVGWLVDGLVQKKKTHTMVGKHMRISRTVDYASNDQ